MKGILTREKIDYVLYHLDTSFDLNDHILEQFIFVLNPNEIQNHKYKIIFQQSDKDINYSEIKWIDGIPVLFPLSNDNFYYKFENGNLIFSDDILKSAFYLLSGYQEYHSQEKDAFGRFRYEKSIQYQLGIIDKPVVNYYFEKIIQGIIEFCNIKNIPCRRKKIFENFGFMLTHDVDRVDAYNWRIVAYNLKQLLGLVKSEYNKRTAFKVFFLSVYHFLNIFSNENPFWTFSFLRSVENNNNLKSVFFFLNKESKLDAYYTFKEKKIRTLIEYLKNENCEIGIHGTMNSATRFESMNMAILELKNIFGEEIIGCRQHFLQFHNPQTIIIQEKSKLKYDSSLTYAEHEGFRNSYCLPFKLYNFAENKIFSIWEFPLNVMEVTLFGYRNLSFDEILKSVSNLITEIKKFNGLFVLLWHNCFFDNYKYKGIHAFYKKLINTIILENPQNILGKDLVLLLEKKKYSGIS